MRASRGWGSPAGNEEASAVVVAPLAVGWDIGGARRGLKVRKIWVGAETLEGLERGTRWDTLRGCYPCRRNMA